MRSTTWKKCFVLLLAVLLVSALTLFCVLAVQSKEGGGNEAHVAAAISPREPTKHTVCPVCANEATAIADADELAYLIANIGGGGSEESVYELTGCYALTGTDYDLTGLAAVTMGDLSSPFAGHFAGSGEQRIKYEVTGAAGKSGLFEQTQGGGERHAVLQNFKIQVSQKGQAGATDYTGALVKHAVNTQISGIEAVVTASDGSHTAGIAGELDASSAITGCAVTAIGTADAGTVYKNFGGIAGINRGTISNCTFTLGAGNYNISLFGGIAAILSGTVENCSAQIQPESVTGLTGEESVYIGGIAGVTDHGVIRNCTAAVNINAASNATAVGGVAGQMNGGAISGCSATGNIAGAYGVGGIVGLTLGEMSDSLIENCLADTNVTVTDMGGGIIGQARTLGSVTIRDSSASGTVTGLNSIGGLVGSIHYYGEGTPENPNAFTMDNCQSYVKSVTSTQPGAGAAAVSGGAVRSSNAGGAIGFVTMGEADYLYCSTTVTNCSAYTEVIASSSCAGGFTGYHLAREAAKSGNQYVYSNCYAYGNVTVSDGAPAHDFMDNSNGMGGGFIGAFVSLSRNMRMYNCHAYGSVAGISFRQEYGSCHFGGFVGFGSSVWEDSSAMLLDNCTASGYVTGVGGVGGFAGRVDRPVLKNCAATGDVLVRDGWSSGGFAGVLTGASISDCVARGSVLLENPSATAHGSTIGGFVGSVSSVGNTIFDRCTAYGSVEGTAYVGGFLGALSASASSDTIAFTVCVAYGNVSDLCNRGVPCQARGYGGFVGATIDLPGSVSYSGCSAYGDVCGFSAGGFSGYSLVRGTQSFVNCNAYGNVNDPVDAGEAGGFTGWARGGVLIANNCHAYGNVSSLADSGGFFGPLAAVGTVTDCSAHASSIIGRAIMSAEFASMYGDGPDTTANGTRFVRCYYENQTNAGWPFATAWGSVINGSTIVQTNTGIGNPVNPNYAEEPSIAVAVANVTGNIRITFSAFANIPAGVSVTDFTLSTDGGRTFTEFLYNGRTLVDIYIGSALLPAGSRIAVTAALSMQYTYHLPAASYPAAGRIRVQLTLSNGFSVTTTV